MNDADRCATVSRETTETTIDVTLVADSSGDAVVDTGIGSFDYILEAFARHGLFDLTVQCDGDLHIDDHHTVGDVAIVLDEMFTEALGDRRGIARYADRKVPLGGAVVSVVVDVSGRPFFRFSSGSSQPYVGEFTSHMAEHFTMSPAMSAGLTLHADVEGDNTHHEIEALFEVLARLPDDAIRADPRRSDTPSTKGKL